MISKVAVKNFKSIRDLNFAATRINVFIGEPNTGKSNVLEALAVFSEGLYEPGGHDTFREVLRFKSVADLFYDRDLSAVTRVVTDGLDWSLKFESTEFAGTYLRSGSNGVRFAVDHSGGLRFSEQPQPGTRYYHFKTLSSFPDRHPGVLRAPHGSNLAAVLATNKRLAGLVDDLFQSKGFHLSIDHERGELALAKFVDRRFFSYSFPTISETLRRIMFLIAVLETNMNSTLLLDEPEANTFPFYTKYLAERIALDETNQFFITTHNPYLLGSVVSKAPAKDVAVFVTRMENFETKIKPLAEAGFSQLLDLGANAFFNLDKLLAA